MRESAIPFKPMLVWVSPIFNTSGYADEARHFLIEISRSWPLKAIHTGPFSEQFFHKLSPHVQVKFKKLIERALNFPFIYLQSTPAYAFSPETQALYNIGRTTFETDRIPEFWVTKCNSMGEIWVPSEFNMVSFRKSGVKVPIIKIPQGINTALFSPKCKSLFDPPRKFVFLSVFEWIYRKGWDILLDAWVNAFHKNDDVCLILKTKLPSVSCELSERKIRKIIDDYLKHKFKLGINEVPPILIFTKDLSPEDMPRLYKMANVFVLPTRGEGWGRPFMEAMSMGIPVIGTKWGGHLDFMNPNNAFVLEIEGLEKVDERMEYPFYHGHYWAKPSWKHLAELMRYVYENPNLAKKKGEKARQDVLRHWNWKTVASKAVDRLEQICKERSWRRKFYIKWEGSQFVYHSLALINREICIQLASKGHELCIIPFEPHQFDSSNDKRFELLEKNFFKKLSRIADVHIRHQWPPNFNPPPEGYWVVIQPWEYGFIPIDWVKPMRELIDEIWIPSRYVWRTYVRSGIPADKVIVIPNGVNTEIYNPQVTPLNLPTEKKFRFLFVGGTIWRKGIDILLRAYVQAFSSKDEVVLVIKDIGQDSFYKNQTAQALIEELRRNSQAPEILYLTDKLSEKEMAGLYRACHCLVHPYRGEGFCLPALEAMACGIPVIVTQGGATDDFCSNEYSYLIPAKLRTFIPPPPLRLVGGKGLVLEPDLDALRDLMRHVYEHYEEAHQKGLKASQYVCQEFTWHKITEKIEERIEALKYKPILRFLKTKRYA